MMNYQDCQLRLMQESDSERVLTWRNSERIRENMYTDHLISLEEHQKWFSRAQADPSVRHLVFEHLGTPLGVINITQIDTKNQRCYWGFYLGSTEAPKGSGLTMGFLGLDYIFHTLGMRKLCGEVFAFNESSIKFHRKLGFLEEGYFKAHILKKSNFEDIICFALFKEEWERLRENIAGKCFEVNDI